MRKLKLLFLSFLLGQVFICAQGYEEVINVYEEESIQTPSKEEIGEIFYESKSLDPGFKEKYKGKKFNYDQKEKPSKPPSTPMFQLPPGLLQVLMYTGLAVILGVIIYHILRNSGGFEFRGRKKKIRYDTVEEILEDPDDIENNDFPRLIQKAKSENNFRLAIRYYHLWVLQLLSDRNLIKWNRDKTDHDYYNELNTKPIQKYFSQNIYIYDYIWYGNFELNPDEFQLAESIFKRTLNKLK